jgi:hypothetical protein
MKKVLLSIILLVICQTISGQQLNQQTNHYRSGDVLNKKKVAGLLTCG